MSSKQANSNNPQFNKVKSIISQQLDDIKKSNNDEKLQEPAISHDSTTMPWWKRIWKRISK